jgi:hypothetical protein
VSRSGKIFGVTDVPRPDLETSALAARESCLERVPGKPLARSRSVGRGGRHCRIDVDNDEFRIHTRCAEARSGGLKKFLIVQYHLGALDKGLPAQGPVSPEPTWSISLYLIALAVVTLATLAAPETANRPLASVERVVVRLLTA